MPPRRVPFSAGPMLGGGAAKSTLAGKANQLRIGDMFLAQLKDPQLKALAGAEWAKMPEAAACSKALIGWLASYIARDYRTEDSDRKPLKGSTALSVWGGLLFQTVERFRGKETTPEGKARRAPPTHAPKRRLPARPPRFRAPPPPCFRASPACALTRCLRFPRRAGFLPLPQQGQR